MRYTISRILSTICLLAISLWLGSLAHLMLSVGTLFTKFPKDSSDVAVKAAPALFNVSEPVHVLLGALAVIHMGAWKAVAKSKSLTSIAVQISLVIGLIFAGISAYYVTPQINALREAGMSSSDDFDFWHKASTKLYMIQFFGVLGATVTFPWAMASSGKTVRSTEQS